VLISLRETQNILMLLGSSGSDFDLALFSSVSSERLCGFGLHGASYMYLFFFVTFFTLPFRELSLVGLTLDLVD